MANTTYEIKDIEGNIHIYPLMQDCYCCDGKHYPLNEVGVRTEEVCPRCNGKKHLAIKADLCSMTPDGFIQWLYDSKVIEIKFRYDGKRNEYRNYGSDLYSCGDYGRWMENPKHQEKIIKEIIEERTIQFCKVVRDTNNRLCDFIEVAMHQGGYAVYGVWNKENNMFSKKLEGLKKEAEEACAFRGHKLHNWENHPDGSSTNLCYMCKKEVVVRTNPRPNEINAGGAAVALGCED